MMNYYLVELALTTSSKPRSRSTHLVKVPHEEEALGTILLHLQQPIADWAVHRNHVGDCTVDIQVGEVPDNLPRLIRTFKVRATNKEEALGSALYHLSSNEVIASYEVTENAQGVNFVHNARGVR
jgi:hypothetical protein